jgi:hypothetical protein
MVISDEKLMYNGQPIADAMRADNKVYDKTKMSFGLHPVTGTREPDNDPQFNCLRTYNMNEWAGDAQLDNFVAFTATNAIQVDLPVNLLINPARTGRIGDGLDSNASLYKVLIFQAPTIVFNRSVNSFVSLSTEKPITQTKNAYRMTTVMLAAPKNTPYSYLHGERDINGKIVASGKGSQTVKAGRVFFAEDAYVWVIPYGEDGSNYKTQTVYYKGKDIILYKVANAGDIFYFNAEVPTKVNGKPVDSGFSLTGYFLDVYYSTFKESNDATPWWDVWGNIKDSIFNAYFDNYKEKTYTKEDLKWVGNIYSGAGEKAPVVDDFYVVWES